MIIIHIGSTYIDQILSYVMFEVSNIWMILSFGNCNINTIVNCNSFLHMFFKSSQVTNTHKIATEKNILYSEKKESLTFQIKWKFSAFLWHKNLINNLEMISEFFNFLIFSITFLMLFFKKIKSYIGPNYLVLGCYHLLINSTCKIMIQRYLTRAYNPFFFL